MMWVKLNSESILNKPDRLTDAEYTTINMKSCDGRRNFALFETSKMLCSRCHHHERMDGKGYPDGLSGQNIPLMGRAIAVVDAFDAMTSDCAYRPAPGVEVAIEEFRRTAGTV